MTRRFRFRRQRFNFQFPRIIPIVLLHSTVVLEQLTSARIKSCEFPFYGDFSLFLTILSTESRAQLSKKWNRMSSKSLFIWLWFVVFPLLRDLLAPDTICLLSDPGRAVNKKPSSGGKVSCLARESTGEKLLPNKSVAMKHELWVVETFAVRSSLLVREFSSLFITWLWSFSRLLR